MIVSNSESANKIAVLMTCFNRKTMTMTCLHSLNRQAEDVEVFLVDDNSSDGTTEAVTTEIPNVHIIHGTGSLFWNRGMHLAWQTALQNKHFDYYILLNDDVRLFPDSIKTLLTDSQAAENKAVIAGAICSPGTHVSTYGGRDILTGALATPNGSLQEIRNLNGNMVLVPCSVVDRIGILDPFYQHHFGDVDYNETARENNVNVYLSSCFVGECNRNSICRIRRSGTTIGHRFKTLFSPLGTPPSSVYHFFSKHHKHLKGICYILYLFLINLIPDKLYFIRRPSKQ